MTGTLEVAAQAAACWFDDAQLAPLGDGHIHDTYLMRVDDRAYVLQRINEAVFVDARGLMAQTRRVLTHWRVQQTYQVPELIATRNGDWYCRVDETLWRAWTWIDGRTIDPLTDPLQATMAARAFARYQQRMASLPDVPLQPAIAGFLQLPGYLDAFDAEARGAPPALREFVDEHRALLAEALPDEGTPIHGDCKINNLLFDAQAREVIAVIDFDTTMAGHWAWDFGDLVRSVWLSGGCVDATLFGACLEGFVENRPNTDTRDAVLAPAYMAYMLGVRFLTDHLRGDVYFRVAQAGENLARAEAQFALVKQWQAARSSLDAVAQDLIESVGRRGNY